MRGSGGPQLGCRGNAPLGSLRGVAYFAGFLRISGSHACSFDEEEDNEEREEEEEDEGKEEEEADESDEKMRDNSLDLSMIASNDFDEEDEKLKLARENTITVVSGYMIKKLRDADKLCSVCANALTGELSGSEDEVYLANKQYADLLDKPDKGLTVSCSELRKAISSLENVYMANTKFLVERKIKERLIPIMKDCLERANLAPCPVGQCDRLSRLVHLYFNIRIHYTLKDSSNSFSKTNTKRNHKLMKLNCEPIGLN